MSGEFFVKNDQITINGLLGLTSAIIVALVLA